MEVSDQPHALAASPPGERATGIHRTESWVGPRAGLDAVAKGKYPSPCQEKESSP